MIIGKRIKELKSELKYKRHNNDFVIIDDERAIINSINPIKDVDGFLPNSIFTQCTPLGVISLFKEINYNFYDMDNYIESISQETIPHLFEKGEDYFREWETKACKEMSKLKRSVIACGGGVVKKDINMEILKKECLIIFIDRPVENIVEDVNVKTRPLLKEGVHKVYDLYNERYNLYIKAADIRIENRGTIDEIILKIKSSVKERIVK